MPGGGTAGLGLVFRVGVGPSCRYLEGGQPSTRCRGMKAGSKQGMLGTLAGRSRWGCLEGPAGRARREHVGKQTTFLWGRSPSLSLNPAAGPHLCSGEVGTSKARPRLGGNWVLSGWGPETQ